MKKMMVKEENSNYTLSYLTSTDSLTNNTWVLGYEEENTHIYFFVLHTTGKTAAASNNSVILLKKILLQQGFLQGLR
jgi:beta-lactamase class D